MPANTITLTKTEPEDLHAFFQFQLDEEANYLAAFTPKHQPEIVLSPWPVPSQTACNSSVVAQTAR